MGNKVLELSLHQSSSIPSCLKFIKQIQMQHFGSVEVFYDTEQRIEVFMKEYSFVYQGEAKYSFLDNVRKINQDTPYLVKLTRLIEATSEENVCNKINKILCFFQYHPLTLKSMIVQRKSQNRYFSEKQIIWFLNCLLKAQLQLNVHGNYHGDIHPQFIYLNSKTNFLMIFDSVFFDTSKAGYYMARSGNSYISPEILGNLAEKRTFPNFNPYKSDVFSIGMVMLFCMTLIDPLLAYDMNKYQIDGYHLSNLLRISSKKYSQNLINLIRSMVSDKRPTSRDIVEQLVRIGWIAPQTQRSIKSQRTNYSLK